MSLGMKPCPGCGTPIELTSSVRDNKGEKIQPIIPKHNPVPDNPNGLKVNEECSGSGAEIGPVIEKKIQWKSQQAAV